MTAYGPQGPLLEPVLVGDEDGVPGDDKEEFDEDDDWKGVAVISPVPSLEFSYPETPGDEGSDEHAQPEDGDKVDGYLPGTDRLVVVGHSQERRTRGSVDHVGV